MKKFVLLLLLALLIIIIFLAFDIKNAFRVLPIKESATLEVPPFADWRIFSAQSDKFEVMLPAVPQYARETVPVSITDNSMRRYEMYVSQQINGPVFMISLITYPKDYNTKDEQGILHSIVDELMQSKQGNKIVNIKESLYQNHEAIDFDIQNKKFNVMGKAFIIDHTVYLLTYIADLPDSVLADYEKFINSFKLPKQESSLPPLSK
ncbi:MAG: hypothetical protein H0W88_04540 [Parachlamydiaceae bacterium]|nr:hypothetical protein [Parachlamydiaceae bacterium]